MRIRGSLFHWGNIILMLAFSPTIDAGDLRVGVAAIDIPADDSMDMAGGIHSWKAQGAEGKLRATTLVITLGNAKLAICSCDVLFVQKDFVDPALAEIEQKTGIPAAHVMVHATHTHAAPSATRVHGYQRDVRFVEGLRKTIVASVVQAVEAAKNSSPCQLRFRLGEESSVGQNSRILLGDGTIYWTGPRDDAVRPTGPFDPELPVLRFELLDGKPLGTIFNHSTHTIGGRLPMKRSPAFYGLAAQELETDQGGTYLFLQGASGSTHNLTLNADEMVIRIKNAIRRAETSAPVRSVDHLAVLKESFDFHVRSFDESTEEQAVFRYCSKRYNDPKLTEDVASVFRTQRQEIAPHRGELRTTSIQTMVIGDIAIVAVPAEFFTILGQEIKRQSPFRYTYISELSNDWIGYVPDKEGFQLGGYQTWSGHHSYCQPGTGERMVATAVEQLRRLYSQTQEKK
jgi:neutral ceramidase